MTTVQEEVWEILRKLALSSEETDRNAKRRTRQKRNFSYSLFILHK